MSKHSVAEAKKRLPELIDRALAGARYHYAPWQSGRRIEAGS